MSNIIQVSAKYLIILLFAVFIFISFGTQQDIPEEKKNGRYDAQIVLLLMIHLLAFVCIALCVSSGDITGISQSSVWILYAMQLAYLLFMMIGMKHMLHLNAGINNVICMLVTVSFIVQTRLSYDTGLKQFRYLLVATVMFAATFFVVKLFNVLSKLTWAYCALGIALILVVLVFASVTGGAQISIDLGFITVQPFEFVKILFVMFVAGAFNKANNLKTVIITAIFAAIHVLLMVYCTELGTALVLFVAYVLMVYVATKKIIYIFIGTAGFAGACLLAYQMFSHVRVRVSVWLDPWADPEDLGYQITQSLMAIASGGWFGTGIGKGSPYYIPKVENDFVFSAVAEEFGMIFAIFLILLCLCLTLMIFRVAIRVYRPFHKLTAFGLGAVYAFQVFLAVGGNINFIPSTGINLPFVSSGGSSIVSSMMMMGIVQALYVISENDVARERKMIAERLAMGTDMDEFENESIVIMRNNPSSSGKAEREKRLERRATRVEQINADDIDF